MKIAFVYDWVVKFGGAERVLLALHDVWPDAPLYTAVYDLHRAPWAKCFRIVPSFLQNFPLAKTHHELYGWCTSLAFESFSFQDYDVVLSISSSDAKAIVTHPHTLHICYCLTPNRYLWSGYHDYRVQPGFGPLNSVVGGAFSFFSSFLRQDDFLASFRPDVYISVSYLVAARIRTYYRRNASVCYPPVALHSTTHRKYPGDYFLVVSRLVPYKKIDYVISTFNTLGWRLKIIGDGIDKRRLERLAKQNIEFLGGKLTDAEVGCYYRGCRALIVPGEEDFGLTAVEAHAWGKPVVAYEQSGVREIVVSGQTGELYTQQSETSLAKALQMLTKRIYAPERCYRNAEKYSTRVFQLFMKQTITALWKEWKKNT